MLLSLCYRRRWVRYDSIHYPTSSVLETVTTRCLMVVNWNGALEPPSLLQGIPDDVFGVAGNPSTQVSRNGIFYCYKLLMAGYTAR